MNAVAILPHRDRHRPAGAGLRARALVGNDYLFFAGYTVLQFIVLATAWNILGGYCGYVNFGSAAFFAIGAYSSVVAQARHNRPTPIRGCRPAAILIARSSRRYRPA